MARASQAAAASSTEVAELKQQLMQSIEGLDRGIFGVQVCTTTTVRLRELLRAKGQLEAA